MNSSGASEAAAVGASWADAQGHAGAAVDGLRNQYGVTVDPAQALARGVTPDALRECVLKQAAERDVAQDIAVVAPAPTSTKPQSVADSPLVKAAQAYGAQK